MSTVLNELMVKEGRRSTLPILWKCKIYVCVTYQGIVPRYDSVSLFFVYPTTAMHRLG